MTLLCASLLPGSAATSAFGQIAGLKPAPGTFAEGKIVIPAGSDAGTEIPITVMKGAKPGPTLAVIAGTGGTAYGPVAATYAISKGLDLKQVSGTLILVHVANVPAYLERAIYVNPIDRKDLDHAFPGKADGTSSERIAHAITTQVIAPADSVVLLQSGANNTMLMPHVFQAVSGDAKLDAKMAEMALAFGISVIVKDKNAKRSGGADGAALAAGKPVLKVMCGSYGISDNRTVDAMSKGVASLLNLFAMTEGKPMNVRSPVFIDQTASMDSPATGALSIYVQRGQSVHKGESVYAVGNLQNKNLVELRAPIDGIILYVISTPPVIKGESVVMIGTPRE
jgi:predicted deacylase